jgi:hypothetical protein
MRIPRIAILSPLLAASTVLADLRGGRRSRYRHDNHQRAAPSAHGGAALLLQVLRAAARLPTAGLLRAGILRAAELFWATLSPPVSRRWHNGDRSGGEIASGRAFLEIEPRGAQHRDHPWCRSPPVARLNRPLEPTTLNAARRTGAARGRR